MKWSENTNELVVQVNEVIKRLGFDMPENSKQLEEWNEAFKDFPYKLNCDAIDPHKILNSVVDS
jgi:hypothetical protein